MWCAGLTRRRRQVLVRNISATRDERDKIYRELTHQLAEADQRCRAAEQRVKEVCPRPRTKGLKAPVKSKSARGPGR